MDCDKCGDGIDEGDLEMCIMGLDVVGLFPAMKSKNIGQILKKTNVKNSNKSEGVQMEAWGKICEAE